MDQQAVIDFTETAIPIFTEFGLNVIGALAILLVGKFAAQGISIPYPQRDVHLYQDKTGQ
jgi:hypothetical protein